MMQEKDGAIFTEAALETIAEWRKSPLACANTVAFALEELLTRVEQDIANQSRRRTMPLYDKQSHAAPDHLRYIFATIEQVSVGRGELERLRCIEREMQAIKNEIGAHSLDTLLLRGDVLEDVFKLL